MLDVVLYRFPIFINIRIGRDLVDRSKKVLHVGPWDFSTTTTSFTTLINIFLYSFAILHPIKKDLVSQIQATNITL